MQRLRQEGLNKRLGKLSKMQLERVMMLGVHITVVLTVETEVSILDV